jgi:hypothetical protein
MLVVHTMFSTAMFNRTYGWGRVQAGSYGHKLQDGDVGISGKGALFTRKFWFIYVQRMLDHMLRHTLILCATVLLHS